MANTSICKKCKKELPIENFKPLVSEIRGLTHNVVCIECNKKDFQRVLYRERKTRSILKIKVINCLGGKCVCCGLTQWWILTVDHIKPIKKDKKIRELIYTLYRKILKNPEIRKDFQILCFGCNLSKNSYESCQLDHSLTL